MSNKKPHPRNYERIARKQALWLAQARARAEIAENQIVAITGQIEEIRLTMSAAIGNISKVDKSFNQLISHYKKS